MKKLFYVILAILGIAYLGLFVGYQIYMIKPFVELSPEIFSQLSQAIIYVPAVLIGATLLIFFAGKGFKTLFFIIVLILVIIGVIIYLNPDLVSKILK